MKSAEIRQAFIDFFVSQGHQQVASSSLIPGNDPTLLFTNAGMVQFKETFLGLEPRSYNRAVSAQRCLRAGGKHNDLENVGYTARHHTFFEMLGNFSFGDYFKREAIQYAWDFLTQTLKLPPEKLWVTVYVDDDEAADIWLKEIGVSAQRFSRCGEQDNFWSMGDTGPCGPCSEIFYDHGEAIAGGPPGSADADGDRYIEIWNLVFMQFNRDKEGNLHPLPKPSVDTGMGLERIAAVVQGVHNNYEIDTFKNIINAILMLAPTVDPQHASLKVIADHLRACSFLIADGVLPGNEGRGYVLRRIIRRAVRHGNKLQLPPLFFSGLVESLVSIMGTAYPELAQFKLQIKQVLAQEENQFSRTIDQGLRLLQEQIQVVKDKTISGEAAFKLYDTYGFPLDLTEDIAREQGLKVDVDGFNQCMQQQRQLSQSSSHFAVDYSAAGLPNIVTAFHGYEVESLTCKVAAILHNGKKIDCLTAGIKAEVILENTPFYAESGGQVGDQGQLFSESAVFNVEDTQKIGQSMVHKGELIRGELKIGQLVEAQVDAARRQAIRLNHTATHLLHAALKAVLGKEVQQKGSLVDAERARFDFSYSAALTKEQLHLIENLVNEQIRANNQVCTEKMSLEAAKESGAMALFGEKYEAEVRVLSIADFSKELCGGTHAERTGDIGLFKITAEYGIASGIRRIEMVTGAYALAWVNQQLFNVEQAALQLKTTPDQLAQKITQLLADLKQQEKSLSQLQTKVAAQSSQDLLSAVQSMGHFNLLIKQLDNTSMQAMRTLVDQLKNKVEQVVIVLFSIEQNKINVIAGISKNLAGQVPSAVELVKHLCGGKGGGRDDMAQGGGDAPSDLEEKIKQLKLLIQQFFTVC